MAFVPVSRVLETGSGTGTGNVTLLGAQGSGEYDAFNERLSVTDGTFYVIVDGSQFEIGYGTYSAATPSNGTFTRDTVIRSSGGTSKISLSGSNFNIFGDIPPEKVLVVGPTGAVTNVSAVAAAVLSKDLATLKALSEPDDNTILGLGYNTTEGDGLGGLFRWDDTSTATADDVHIIELDAIGSSPGRFIRERQFVFLGEAASDPTVDDAIMRRSDTHDIKSKRADTGAKLIPEVENAYQGEYTTLAALKAAASSKWKQGDKVILRGVSAEDDIVSAIGTWQASSTNTDALDVTFVRPDDISGSNPGRFQFTSDLNSFNLRGQRVKTHYLVIDRDLLTPPGTPAEGDHYLLPASGTLLSGWSSFSNNDIVAYFGGAWIQIAPAEGDTVDVLDEDTTFRYSGSAWLGASGDFSNTSRHVTATNLADATNAINTTGKVLGSIALDSTNNRMFFALGANATSAWRPFDDQSSIADVTPA